MAHALRRKPHIWHNVGRYNPVIVIGSDFVWVSIMKPHLSLGPGHQHYTVLEMDKGNSRSTWLHNSYSVTNSTGATQHFSAKHKTNSEQMNRRSFIFWTNHKRGTCGEKLFISINEKTTNYKYSLLGATYFQN